LPTAILNSQLEIRQLLLEPDNARRLASLCGQLDANLRHIEQRLDIEIHNRGNAFKLLGSSQSVSTAQRLLQQLYAETARGTEMTPDLLHLHLQESSLEALNQSAVEAVAPRNLLIRTPRLAVKPRGSNQQLYVRAIDEHDINFGLGPAGTGKTFLAVACAVRALEEERVGRILLVRPAVEAGEKLGFLPGDLASKIDPYLRPLYDALYEMMGFERVGKLIERNVIEVAPLAFMRGRTLNNAFIILDEGQNTTGEQMKMFLTRIGFGSTVVVTGDLTQTDLPRGVRSGLWQAVQILQGIAGVSFTRFDSKDVVRHPLVQKIVEAYDRLQTDEDEGSRRSVTG
jgi:phosphate starvation-inducible PhoH-like protein